VPCQAELPRPSPPERCTPCHASAPLWPLKRPKPPRKLSSPLAEGEGGGAGGGETDGSGGGEGGGGGSGGALKLGSGAAEKLGGGELSAGGV
jgi:hypothetical protein